MKLLNKIPSIGIALGSGSARGMAHVGVLKALEENNIYVDCIAGSSAGALIAGLYSCGIEPNFISRLFTQIERKLWIDVTVPRRGLMKGDKIEEILKLLTRDRSIEELNKRLSIVATDLVTCQEYIFDKGPIYKAIRASISLPGIFMPVRIDDRVLVDGGVIDRVPASVVKDMGADVVIAVDVGFSTQQGRINHIFDVIMQSIDVMAKQIMKNTMIHADVIIKPELSHINPSKFNEVKECTEIGYNATLEKIDQIKEIIQNHKEKRKIKS